MCYKFFRTIVPTYLFGAPNRLSVAHLPLVLLFLTYSSLPRLVFTLEHTQTTSLVRNEVYKRQENFSFAILAVFPLDRTLSTPSLTTRSLP
ncbi:MAG: hypothetical protein A2284_04790 [Deltaproteobacteria bacterium RIFOXYA12_FULL_61_11]|nr:MAG: hypothetical protein A2284_04790 [Deltaproteobacteria bacterium RIFOXYA12_FULL_61_11]